MKKRLPLLLAFSAAFAVALPAEEPANLEYAKQAVTRYLASGEYAQDVAAVALRANKYLTKRVAQPAKPGEKRAIVFDIDETTLSNLSHIKAEDYGYVPAVWDRWVDTAQGRAIVPVQVVYDLAVRNNVAVIFITAREPAEAAATEKNLRQVGYETWTKIFYRPADFKGSVQGYKTDTRRKLVAEGYTIVANIGDQESDLAGGYAEKTFKLPNPVYIVK